MSPVDRPIAEHRLEARLKWLMSIRLIVAVGCLFAIVVFESGLRPFLPQPHYVVLTLACAVNLAYLIAARLGTEARRLAVVQLTVDVLLVTALVYVVGPSRLYVVLYFAVVIGVAFVLGLRAALLMAAQAAVFLAAVVALYYAYAQGEIERLPFVDPSQLRLSDLSLSFLTSYTGFCALGLVGVALLAGRLSDEMSQVRILNDEILQNMAGGVVAVDRFGGVAYANQQARRMLRLREGTELSDYMHVMPKEVAFLFKIALSGGGRVEREISVDGTPLEISISPLQDERRAVIRGVVAIVNDMSLRNEVEKVTQQAGRFRALVEMSAGIAHEIRNPIASIRGAAQELQEAKFDEPDARKLLAVVMRESDRLNKIITDFLDYASDRPMQAMLINISELLAEVVVLLEAREGAATVAITLEAPRTMVCRGSGDKLKQVFLNLGVNALDAMGEKGGRLIMRCLSASALEGPPREGVLVEFEDNGPGIDHEHVTRIFDPFFTTKSKGTGMGLAIARKIVHAHNGTIVAESPRGQGALFRVWLPAD